MSRFSRAALTVAALVLCSTRVQAQVPYIQNLQVIVPINTVTSLPPAAINVGGGHPQANYGICRLEVQEVRYTLDAVTVPSATMGLLLQPGELLTFPNATALLNFQVWDTTPGDNLQPVLNCIVSDTPGIGLAQSQTQYFATINGLIAPSFPQQLMVVTGGFDANGTSRAFSTDTGGVLQGRFILKLPCNALRTTNCQ